MALTGRFEFRRSRTGKVVLQVEDDQVRSARLRPQKTAYRRRWRDAKVMDLATLELRALSWTLSESAHPEYPALRAIESERCRGV